MPFKQGKVIIFALISKVDDSIGVLLKISLRGHKASAEFNLQNKALIVHVDRVFRIQPSLEQLEVAQQVE